MSDAIDALLIRDDSAEWMDWKCRECAHGFGRHRAFRAGCTDPGCPCTVDFGDHLPDPPASRQTGTAS